MKITRCRSKEDLDRRAAETGAAILRAALQDYGSANIIVATGMSQAGILENLAASPNLDWSKITGFHLDEYVGLAATHLASFRRYLKERFLDMAPLKEFHFINGEADPVAECRRVGEILARHPIQLAFVGVGENGHLAFNDPPADFETEVPFRMVDLSEASRVQQVGEHWFDRLEDVPRQAISMSIRQILKAGQILCSVPGARKANAVKAALEGPITPSIPASILQRHPRTEVFLDPESSALLAAPGTQ